MYESVTNNVTSLSTCWFVFIRVGNAGKDGKEVLTYPNVSRSFIKNFPTPVLFFASIFPLIIIRVNKNSYFENLWRQFIREHHFWFWCLFSLEYFLCWSIISKWILNSIEPVLPLRSVIQKFWSSIIFNDIEVGYFLSVDIV